MGGGRIRQGKFFGDFALAEGSLWLSAMSGGAAGGVLQACLDHGIREFVVCGGARNAPLVCGLLRNGEVVVWRHFEERGAGFFALGRVMAEGRPVAVVTTSGTAAAELLPAVIEAHYQGRPLVLLTADRPKRFRGSGAPQAIEQADLFGGYVEGRDDVEQDAGELLAGWSGARPWHLNVCQEEDEGIPAVTMPTEDWLPPQIERPGVAELVEFLGEDRLRGLVVMLGGLDPEEREETRRVLAGLGAPVVADAASGLREALGKLVMVGGDELLRRAPPGRILRLGDVPVGRFWRDLEELPEVAVLSVTRTGFSGLARDSGVIRGRVDHALHGMGEVAPVGDVVDLLPRAAKQRGRLDELLERHPDSEPAMVRLLSTYATTGRSVYLGNSLPVREWNLAAQTSVPVTAVRANRGANGIDGQVSTWLGATATEEGAWGVFGDLTALCDLAAPAWLTQVECRGRVLAVINNGGGRIFERLPRFRGMDRHERAVISNAHELGFGPLAAMWEMEYVRVEGRDEFDLPASGEPMLLEICPDPGQTADFWAAWEGGRR